MKMIQEKTMLLQTGRSVKIIAQDLQDADVSDIEVNILIKEPSEAHYHEPIGITHPKYWKLKQMSPQKSRQLQIEYSGLSQKQLRNAVRELKQIHKGIR